MPKVGLWVPLHAKTGKEHELENFIRSAQALAEREPGTVTWYAVRMGAGSFGIFDTFDDEAGRNAHLSGEIAKALMAKAAELLAKPPEIHKIDILAAKSTTRRHSAGA
jgi:quinol monooxygenase YgiN